MADPIGMRDRLIHAYDIVDTDIVWNAVRSSLPTLEAVVLRLLAELDHTDG